MASEAPKKAPGKLKFNAAMFNKAMGNQKPGAKNPLEQKKKSGPPKPLKPPEDQFSRPTAPRRRVKSKHKLDLDAETKEEANKFYNQSFIAQTEQESKDNSDESDPNTTQNTADNPTDDAEDTNTDDNHTNDAEDTNTDDVTNKLDSALQDRASKDELHDKQILKHPKIDASLQPQADNLEKQLETRTPVSPGYVDDKVAPALAAAAKALDRNLRSDRVSQALKPEKRSTVQSLQDQGVLQSTNVAPSLAATSRLLDKKLTTDKLNQKLGDDDRKTFDELTDKGVIPHSNLSYNLRQNAKKLEQAQRKDQVSKGLKDRQSVDDLHESGVYAAHPHEVAPSMHGAASDLQKSMQKDAVSQGLRDRQTVEELHESGVLAEYPSAMAPSMHSAAKNLRVSMNKDQLRQGLRDRQTVDELYESGVLTSNPHQIAPSIHAVKNDLQKEMAKDSLKQGLQDRSTVDDLTQSNVLTNNPEQIAPSIQAARNDLQRSLAKDGLKQGLRDREELETLHGKNIITRNVDPKIAAHKRALSHAKKVDLLNERLIDPERPDNEDLVEQGILYSSTMSPAIQSNAKELEEQMRQQQHNRDLETTSSPSNEQSPTATDIEEEEYERLTKRKKQDDGIQRKSKSRKLTADFLEEFLENRFDYDEIAERGIIQEMPSIHEHNYKFTQNNQPAAHLTKKQIRSDRKRVSKLLDTRFGNRKSPQELEIRGLLPKDYFDDPATAYEMRYVQRKLAKEDLKRKLKGRTPVGEIVQRGIAQNDFWKKTPEEIRQDRRRELKQHKKELKHRLHKDRRPSVHDLVAQQIMPEDTAVIQELKNIAHSHKRMESAVKDLATHLPFDEEINKSVAATMMRHVNATEEDVDLEDCDTDDLFSDDDHKPNKRGDDEEDSDIDYNASSDIEDHKDENAIKFDLDTTVKKNYKRRLSQTIEDFIRYRPNIKELEERVVLKQTALAHSLRGSAVALEERLNKKMTHLELVARNIIKRPSICNSLQPNADALEAALIRDRPDTDDLVEQGILYSSTMAPATQSKAKVLELKLQQGIMYSSTMAPAIQSKAKDLELKLRLHKDGIQDEEQKCNDNNEHKKEEDEDEDERVEKQFKLFLKKCKTMRYFDKFVENECCNMESIRYFDDEFLSQDIGMKSKILRKTFLRQCNKVVQKMDAFENNYGINEVL
eukprot:730102_1